MSGTEPRRACPSSDVVGTLAVLACDDVGVQYLAVDIGGLDVTPLRPHAGLLPPSEAHDLDAIDEISNLEIGSAWDPIDLGHKTAFGKQLVAAG
jgi:hypothetical protein